MEIKKRSKNSAPGSRRAMGGYTILAHSVTSRPGTDQIS